MQFENVSIDNLVSNFKNFAVEGFSLFATGRDGLPHLICTCPNKDITRAIQSALTVATKAQALHVVNAYITSNCYLSPKILADGMLGMVATVINDAVYMDGKEVEYEEPELQLGTLEYENFICQLLDVNVKDGDS